MYVVLPLHGTYTYPVVHTLWIIDNAIGNVIKTAFTNPRQRHYERFWLGIVDQTHFPRRSAFEAQFHHFIPVFSTLYDSQLILSISSTRLIWTKCTSGLMPRSSVLITLRRIVRWLEALRLSWYHHRYDKLWQINVMMSTGSPGSDWVSSSPERVIWHAILFGTWRSIVRGKRSFGACLIP